MTMKVAHTIPTIQSQTTVLYLLHNICMVPGCENIDLCIKAESGRPTFTFPFTVNICSLAQCPADTKGSVTCNFILLYSF